MRIKFTQNNGLDLPSPVPASHLMPEWYKNLKPDIGKDGQRRQFSGAKPSRTIKACAPFQDALTAGYFITLPVDVYVEKTETGPHFKWPDLDAFSTHSPEQIGEMPTKLKMFQGKWNNPWIVETPPGYSCLFKQPEYRDLPFRVHEAVVETDRYYQQINFPFDWVDDDFEGIIPAGTPIVQIIPFKRQDWQMEIGEINQVKRSKAHHRLQKFLLDSYKRQWWVKKIWK